MTAGRSAIESRTWVCGAAESWARSCAPVRTPATTDAPGRGAGHEVARRVAGDRDLLHRVDVEPHERGQDQVGIGAAPDAVTRAEREVDEVAPAEHVHRQLPGPGREPGRQADPHAAARAARRARPPAPGSGSISPRRTAAVERRLEPPVGLLRPVLVAAEHGTEDGDLRLAHGRRAHSRGARRSSAPSGSKPMPGERFHEGPLDDATVADGRTGHVEHCKANHHPAPLERLGRDGRGQVMPRPPGPGDDDQARLGRAPGTHATRRCACE